MIECYISTSLHCTRCVRLWSRDRPGGTLHTHHSLPHWHLTPYKPQSLLSYLLDSILYDIDTCTNATTGVSPFERLFKRTPVTAFHNFTSCLDSRGILQTPRRSLHPSSPIGPTTLWTLPTILYTNPLIPTHSITT